jgi:hypothetical protein
MDHLTELKEAATTGKLVIIFGAGTSLGIAHVATPARSWTDLLKRAFSFANEAGHVDDAQHQRWLSTLVAGDLDELLGAAEFVSRKLGGRKGLLYSRWLEDEFSQQRITSASSLKNSISLLHKARIPLCTLNYDTLLERVTRSSSITMADPRSVLSWANRQTTDILHLHGLWSAPETVILGVSDYQEATNDAFREAIQRGLSTFNRIVFIGCGDTLYDPNFSSLLSWMREVFGGSALQHYALVRDSEVEAKLRDKIWQGLVRPIGYGPEHTDLGEFIGKNLVPDSPATRRSSRRSLPDADVIQSYRRQLIIDSGKMTIEGVRADADTAKQKFDLERLFVPLVVGAIPPEYAPNDPDREKKLKKWHEENGSAVPFGEALAQNGRLALLALPGGGKTLLLKRLAVAYADPDRREKTDDNLPNLDLLPILIRCREWRNYITLPISTMISKLSEITGNAQLKGLLQALDTRLRSGKVLLLVDGLDEIHSDAERCVFVDNLEAFLDEHKKVRLVVTSREAGFALVAPSLMRFCNRWRIAPLTEQAIALLCSHWHALMGTSVGTADEDTRDVVQAIAGNSALQRLAENPLLLTMLLVVKHGYGRLPPDRVTLYDRAVEVLLDTWNIHGHAALNPREAVPQIAYVAYKMMEQRKQTATESELLTLIEECRREVPLVRLYAKDSPSEFLKRVELRSSLLLEAGKSPEGGKLVPFYQFRHLTFQEYMAAIAVVDGHYAGYSESDVALLPIIDRVVSDEWKEVVPMAAVLAKKRASAIFNELLSLGDHEEKVFLTRGDKDERYEWSSAYRLPAPISRLLQCLIEEAEITQESLDRSARLIATFAHGCQPQENWSALMRGPFGQLIFEEAWRLFEDGSLPKRAWLRNTTALMAALRRPLEYWLSHEGLETIRVDLTANDAMVRAHAASVVCGLLWQQNNLLMTAMNSLKPYLEANVLRDDPPYCIHAIWALGMIFSRRSELPVAPAPLSPETLEKLKRLWIVDKAIGTDIVPFTISVSPLLARGEWQLVLTQADTSALRKFINKRSLDYSDKRSPAEAAVILFYYAGIKVKTTVLKEVFSVRSAGESDRPLLHYFKVADEDIVEIVAAGESRQEQMRLARRQYKS